jgi:hypothetical protein
MYMANNDRQREMEIKNVREGDRLLKGKRGRERERGRSSEMKRDSEERDGERGRDESKIEIDRESERRVDGWRKKWRMCSFRSPHHLSPR